MTHLCRGPCNGKGCRPCHLAAHDPARARLYGRTAADVAAWLAANEWGREAPTIAPPIDRSLESVAQGGPAPCCGDPFIDLSSPPAPIPKVFHRVWLGPNVMPTEFIRYGASWLVLHPGWEMWTWHYGNIEPLRLEECKAWGQVESFSGQSDIIRYTALLMYGGVYIDTDFECFKNIEPLLAGQSFVAAREDAKYVGSAFFAACAGHPVLAKIVARLSTDGIPPGKANGWTGPTILTEALKGQAGVSIRPAAEFYPYGYREKHRCGEAFPDTYAIHRWEGSWLK